MLRVGKRKQNTTRGDRHIRCQYKVNFDYFILTLCGLYGVCTDGEAILYVFSRDKRVEGGRGFWL